MKRKRDEEEEKEKEKKKKPDRKKKCAYLNFFTDFLVIFQLFGFDSG